MRNVVLSVSLILALKPWPESFVDMQLHLAEKNISPNLLYKSKSQTILQFLFRGQMYFYLWEKLELNMQVMK